MLSVQERKKRAKKKTGRDKEKVIPTTTDNRWNVGIMCGTQTHT